MNKIFRIVWSQATQSWVVVSELTKAHKKQSSSNAQTQRSTVKFSGNFIKSSAIALSLLSGHSAYAALNNPGTGDGNGVAWGENSTGSGSAAVAIGRDANATGYQSIAIGKGALSNSNSAVALGQDSKATGSGASALSVGATASGNNAVALSYKSNASGTRATAIGEESNASSEDGIALGYKTQATSGSAVAIGREVVSSGDSAVALGKGSKATGRGSLALATEANATGNDSYAIGWRSDASAESTMAFGHSSKAKKNYDIAFGRGAETRDQGVGHSIAIGYGASAASNRGGLDSNPNSTGTLSSAGGVAIGTGAYTGINRNNTAINSSVAVGAGAGAGYRGLGADGLPTGNGTDPDDNATVLVKAFGGTTSTLDYFKNTGSANGNGFFSYQNVDINEATAVGRNTRAIGDQSVAIGAQSIAGQGSIVIGGNDIQAYDGKKYFKAADPNSEAARSVNDFNAETTPGTGKNNQPITISAKYAELVGAGLDNSYRASYGQDGSTVIGMQAHSTTPLGVAIGTNSIVRKGAFGATAIGSGASVLANAEAAVAIGMGAEAQGNYAVAAGTAARAKESAVATGYQANADKSAVAVGDSSKAAASSVAVGQLAQATKEADIAVGQGAKASGNQGAIAMGLGTQAQGDSSIMIGGSEITKVAAQTVNYQKEKKDANGHTVIKTTTKVEHIGGEDVHRTIRSVEMEGATGTIQAAYGELTNGAVLNTTTLDYSKDTNKNGHGSISMGIHSLSTGDLGTAIGTGARVTKLGGVALGTGAISELQNGVAIGTGSKADANSIGTRQTDISYDKEGKIVPFDSKKVAYTFYWAGGTNTSEGDVVSFGTPGAERQLKNVAAGRIADDSTDAINGSQLNSVTKRMSSGWAVEAEKDKDSSGVLKLNGVVANAGSEVHSTDGKTTNRVNEGTATGQVDKVRLNDEVKFRVGDNLVLHQQDASRPVYEDPDNPNRQTGARVTSKFTYSLNPNLTGLTSAEFKDAAGNKTVIDGNGVTVKPVTQGKEAVSLTTSGLNNGGNAISNVASNLPSTKNSDAATGPSNATKSQDAPTLGNTANQVNPTNAATVSDVLNAGWNIQGDGKAVDFVKPYDTVNFVKGDGTSVAVESADGKTSTVKYNVNLGNGLEKNDANQITVKPADSSLVVEAAGVKVNTGTINNVTEGNTAGTVASKTGDENKVATVGNVVNAINSAAWTATSLATTKGELGATATNQLVKAGDKVTFEADKNIKITQDGSKFTFATKDNVSFNTVQIGGDQGPKFSKTDAGDIKVSGSDDAAPVKITNVKPGDISETSTDAINGSQFHGLAKNTIKLAGKTGDAEATETAAQDLDKKGGIKFTVKSSDGSLLEVAAEGDTITLTPKTGKITTTDGVPTATTTNGKLVTADEVVNALKEMGWKATAGKEDTGTVDGNTEELIKAGETVTFKAGDNLAVKQAGKNFIYSLQKELTGLTSAEFKDGDNKVKITPTGITITKPAGTTENTVTLNQNGLNNGGNPITNVTSNLVNYSDPDVNGKAPVRNQLRNFNNDAVPDTNAATVGDLRNMGWVVSSNKTTGDLGNPYSETVKNANEVKFVGEGTAIVSGKTEGNIRTITVKVDDQVSTNKSVTPVVYTDENGKQVYPTGKVDQNGNQIFNTEPDGSGTEVTGPVKTTINGPKGTKSPTTLSNVEGNLDGAKTGTNAPTTSATAPTLGTEANQVNKNNAATVGDVLQAGWNLQNNGAAKDFVKPYDTVNFADGNGTTAVVDTTENKTSTVKYNVNLGNGLEKNDANQITVKPADSSLVVEAAGVKVNTGTINNVTEGNTAGTVASKTGDENKVATVGNVVNAINSAAWTATSLATTKGELGATATNQLVKAGDKVTFEADKNIKITQDGSKFTFATKDNVSFNTVQIGGDQGPKFSKTDAGDIKVSGSDDAAPVKITNVKPGDISETSTDAINGSQFHGLAKNTIKLAGKTGDAEATETAAQDLDKKGGIKFTVKSSDGSLLEVAAEGDTITLTPKTGKITTTDGVPTATTTNGKLVTADEVVNALKEMGWKATAGKEDTGTVDGNTEELIKAGETVTFKAGDNLAVKQAGKNFIYSLQKELTGLTSAEFKDGDNKVKITPTGITITKPAGTTENTVTLNQNGLNNGGNPITNVTSNLVNYSDPDVNGKAPVRNQLRNFNNDAVPDTNAATVGDLRNMGWVVSSNKTTGDLGNPYSETVKNANEVKFVGEGTAIVSGKTEGNIRTITVKVDDQVSTNKSVTPVVYTDENGKQVYPTGKVDQNGNQIFNTEPDGSGTEVTGPVKTTINGPKGTKSPTTLSNVEGNLDGAKTGTNAPTTSATAPTLGTEANQVNKNNAATVGDVLQAGWNLQNNGAAKDFVKPYDTVNFADGNGTTAVVDTTENKTSTVKYNVNLGNGLEKNDANQITVKPADSSLVVEAAGVKVNTGTINNVTEGNTAGTVASKTGDENKVATVGNVVNAINSAAWTATSLATTKGELGATATNQLVKAGDKVTFEADKNIKITQDGSKFTFATKDNVSFNTVQIGGDQGPKFSKTDAGDIKVSGSDDAAPVKITNVKPGDISETSTDAINGSQFHGLAKNTIKLAGKTGDAEATETAAQDLDKKGGIKFTVKSSDGSLLEVAAEGDTITLTPKTGKITTTDGVPTATTTNGKLVTADEVVNALKEMGWKATAGKEDTGTVDGNTEELIKAGETVTFKAGDNLAVKQAGKNFIYSLQKELTGLTSAEFKDGDNKVKITPTGITITKPAGTTENTVTLNQNGLNNGGNPITNVTSNLVNYSDPDVNGKAPVRNQLRNFNNDAVPDTNAATVGDLRNMGWVVSSNKTTGDLGNPYSETVKNANEVKFIGKNGIQVSGKTDAEGVRTLTFEMEAGEVTPTEITKADGTKLVKVGDKVYKPEDIGTDGQPKQGKDPVGTIANDGKVYNNGDVTNGAPNNGANPIDGITVTPNNGSKFVTGNQVADAIEKSGFVVGKNNKALSASDFENKDEKVNPNDELRFADGDNTNVKLATKEVLDASGKVKTVTTVKVDVVDLPVKYTDADGNIVKKGEDGKYYNPKDLEGKVYDPTTKEFKNSDGTALDKQPEAKNNIVSSLVNPNDAKDGKVGTPSTLTNIANGAKTFEPVAADGTKLVQVGDKFYPADKVENGVLKPGTDATADAKDPVKVANDGKWYLASQVEANGKPKENATPITDVPNNIGKSGLVDFSNSNPNNAATVGDLQNLGFVVSTSDNKYSDQVRNANKVDFKGGNGIEVTGKTTADGIREITVGIKEGEVTNKVTITHAGGTKTDAVKIGDKYYKVDKDGKPVGFDKGPDGKPAGTPLNVDPNTDKVTNAGAGFVTGNTVANAIQDSGWNVGIGSTDKDFSKDAKVYDKVNPNDEVKFANGANTNVSMVTVDALNEDGTKKATTFVKVDINRDLKIDSVTTGGTATDKNGNNLVKVGDQYYKEGDVTVVTNPDGTKTVTPKENAKAVPPADVIPAKDGAMIVKNADGKDVVSATVGKDGNGAFGINGKDGKNGISMTAKDGQGTIGVNGKDGKSTTIVGDTITIKDKDNNATNIGVNTITLVDKAGNTTTTTADKSEIKDAAGNMNTSTPTTNVLKDTNGNTNASTATGTTYTDKDKNTTTVGPKEIALSDKDGNNTSKLTNNDLLLNTKDPNTGVEKTSHMSGDKISFNTTDEIEKGPDGKPVIDPKTNNPKVKNPGNSTEYTNEGLKVIPNSTVARDVNGNPTFLDKDGKPVMKDKDGSYKYMGQDGKPGANYTGAVGSLKSNVVDNTRVISFGMDKPVLDSNGKPVMGPDGKPVMTEGISAGMQRVHNVAPGRISPTSTDAVNGSQLYAVASNIGNLNNKINKVGKRADAGTASALAAATIPQAYTPGKSLVGIAAGSYQGQNGLAVGMSRISDNGKIIIRLSGTANTQGKTGVAAGVGYQW
ncbi:YadA-like family protein [Haemophilus haemolyticus]|uniref:YadA-like family protein n=1 Tax=Haemophilus haemolyticus TaxID=726 RepID=UPI000E0DA004|nr:YadA-like family protein [Haemophilus haemolyticus]